MQFGILPSNRSYDTLLDIFDIVRSHGVFVVSELHTGIAGEEKPYKISSMVPSTTGHQPVLVININLAFIRHQSFLADVFFVKVISNDGRQQSGLKLITDYSLLIFLR